MADPGDRPLLLLLAGFCVATVAAWPAFGVAAALAVPAPWHLPLLPISTTLVFPWWFGPTALVIVAVVGVPIGSWSYLLSRRRTPWIQVAVFAAGERSQGRSRRVSHRVCRCISPSSPARSRRSLRGVSLAGVAAAPHSA
ncbi:MAG TPA: hypothetical protein VI076_01375 [Actinopolymorphaceae bacterium]